MAIAVTVPLTVATSGVYFELLSHSTQSSTHASALVVRVGLLQLRTRIHDEGALVGDRLVQRLPTQQQQLRVGLGRACAFGREPE
jgi:hypothetical protein